MAFRSASITKIVQRLSRGDKSAVTKLWSQIWDGVKDKATDALGSRRLSEVHADDVAQEAILDVIERVTRRKADKKLRSRHVWRMLIGATSKRARKIKRTEMRDRQVLIDRYLMNSDGVPEQFPSDVFTEELEGIASQLDEESKTIVIMLAQGYSTTDVSDKLMIAPRTVQRRIHRIRNFLIRQEEEEKE